MHVSTDKNTAMAIPSRGGRSFEYSGVVIAVDCSSLEDDEIVDLSTHAKQKEWYFEHDSDDKYGSTPEMLRDARFFSAKLERGNSS